MADFQEYQGPTNTINEIVTTQLSSVLSWTNVPGGLTKASSSAAGFIWGFNSSGVYYSPLPTTGNWKQLDLAVQPLDITTDQTNVYILNNSGTTTSLLIKPANNQGEVVTVNLAFPATKIFSTHTYIWAQDEANNKQRCPKPCTMSNWQQVSENTIQITSSDDSSLYGKDSSGQAMQTDETLQSAWQPIAGIKGTVYGKGLDGTFFGVDNSQQGFQYKDSLEPLYTSGLQPTNLTVDANNNQLWMTTSSPGAAGNVFTRLQKPDYTSIMNSISPLDKVRDNIVGDIEHKFNRQTDVMVVNKQSNDIIQFFKKIFNIDGTTHKKAQSQIGILNQNIRETQSQLDEIKYIEPFLLGAIGMLVAVVVIYIFLTPLLGQYVHVFVLATLSLGAWITVNFSIGNK